MKRLVLIVILMLALSLAFACRHHCAALYGFANLSWHCGEIQQSPNGGFDPCPHVPDK
jgi:hypothetical protein